MKKPFLIYTLKIFITLVLASAFYSCGPSESDKFWFDSEYTGTYFVDLFLYNNSTSFSQDSYGNIQSGNNNKILHIEAPFTPIVSIDKEGMLSGDHNWFTGKVDKIYGKLDFDELYKLYIDNTNPSTEIKWDGLILKNTHKDNTWENQLNNYMRQGFSREDAIGIIGYPPTEDGSETFYFFLRHSSSPKDTVLLNKILFALHFKESINGFKFQTDTITIKKDTVQYEIIAGDSMTAAIRNNENDSLLVDSTENNPINNETESASLLTVISDRAYFYGSPVRATRKNSFLIKGDEIKLNKASRPWGGFIYVTYDNNGIITKGWMLQNEFERK